MAQTSTPNTSMILRTIAVVALVLAWGIGLALGAGIETETYVPSRQYPTPVVVVGP